jgi:hypothetical protein
LEYRRFLPFTCLIFIILLTSIVYSPGLKGGFLFDDYYNLAEMNRYGDPMIGKPQKNLFLKVVQDQQVDLLL